MVDSSRRRGRREVMGNHNRCWIWGRNVVQETVRAGRWPVLELLIGDWVDSSAAQECARLAEQRQVPVYSESESELTRHCRTAEHQGFAARMAPFPCLTFDELMNAMPQTPAIAILDRLQDPFNFGAIIRSASTLGIHGIIIGDREQADINSQVARSSVGAINHLPIARTDNLPGAAQQLLRFGFQVVAASEKSSIPLHQADFSGPTAIVIGNEGRGICPELLSLCSLSVRIPMTGKVGSLNAAVAAGILFYEMSRQRSLLPPQ